MDPREASTEFRHRPRDAMNTAPPLAPFKREAEPWRGSSGFGLADILNRSSSSTGASSGPSIPPPKFSLPALHSFSKPLVPPSERSILNEPSREDAAQYAAVSSRQQQQQQQQQQSPVASPAKGGSRRIAPAPVDEEEGEAEEDLASSIRGGRWTADEHERFLEGFRVHGHKWKRVQQVVRTRSVTQVRTHAQKYLLKVAKLKAERKHKAEAGGGGGGDRYDPVSDQDASQTAPSSPARSTDSGRSPRRSTPRKKVRKLEHGSSDPVDQEYIAAAATTLCFLMTQKIVDTRLDLEGKDLEPYDCYSTAAPAEPERFAVAADDSGYASANARKRSFMHFITESPPRFETERADYRAYDSAEPSAYAVEGNRLCS